MHFLLSTAIVAGLLSCGFSQDASKYSDCDTEQTIIGECVTKHLGNLAQPLQQQMAVPVVDILENPMGLIQMELPKICKNTTSLKMYYKCVYADLTTCLQEKNSSQAVKVPITDEISMGVVDLCMKESTMNTSCLAMKQMDVKTCMMNSFRDVVSVGPSPVCQQYEIMHKCADSSFEGCEGREAVLTFISSARSNPCDNLSGSASQAVATVSMLLLSLLLGLAISL